MTDASAGPGPSCADRQPRRLSSSSTTTRRPRHARRSNSSTNTRSASGVRTGNGSVHSVPGGASRNVKCAEPGTTRVGAVARDGDHPSRRRERALDEPPDVPAEDPDESDRDPDRPIGPRSGPVGSAIGRPSSPSAAADAIARVTRPGSLRRCPAAPRRIDRGSTRLDDLPEDPALGPDPATSRLMVIVWRSSISVPPGGRSSDCARTAAGSPAPCSTVHVPSAGAGHTSTGPERPSRRTTMSGLGAAVVDAPAVGVVATARPIRTSRPGSSDRPKTRPSTSRRRGGARAPAPPFRGAGGSPVATTPTTVASPPRSTAGDRLGDPRRAALRGDGEPDRQGGRGAVNGGPSGRAAPT